MTAVFDATDVCLFGLPHVLSFEIPRSVSRVVMFSRAVVTVLMGFFICLEEMGSSSRCRMVTP